MTDCLTPLLIARVVAARPATESSLHTHSIVARLSVACRYAKSRGYIRVSPFDFRKSFVRRGHPIGKVRHHPLADLKRVLDLLAREVLEREDWPQWRARRLYALTALFCFTGLRLNEGLHLRIEDIDLEARMIAIVPRVGNRLKTELSAQPVPIPDALATILANWLPHTGSDWVFPGVTRKGPWINGPRGHRPLDQLRAAGERAGVQDLTFLSLRHSFATNGESAWGLSREVIQRILRHADQTTQNWYRHADTDNLRRAVGGIGFGPPEGEPTS